MGRGDAALGHHLDDIAGAELKRQIPPDAQDDDFLVKVSPFEEILCSVPSSQPLSPDTAPFNSLHQNLSRTFLNAGRICGGETLALPSSLITRVTSNRLAV
jgi:hypothetical protein